MVVVTFRPSIVLTKREAFEVCEACAVAERALLKSGRETDAGRLAALFALIEGRLVSAPGEGAPDYDVASPDGSKSSDSEFTQ